MARPASPRAFPGPQVALPCACANLRRAARAVTQLYDQELRPSGLRLPQFTLLMALARVPGISQGQLAALLDLDSTTLTRTLARLRRQGCVRAEPGADRRQLRLALAPAGVRAYRRALPRWRAAQGRLRRVLGASDWRRLWRASLRTARLVQSS